jgi:hypothetical protein
VRRLSASTWVLPERSYDEIVPGYDRALITGILVARRNFPS